MNLDWQSTLPSKDSFERFCNCSRDCSCGEKNIHEWIWDENVATDTYQLSKNKIEVKIHPYYSIGTAAIRGNQPMIKDRHHYWEVKMLSSIYGTDVMVGVGTAKVEMIEQNRFFSFLGQNQESWGFSYKGFIQHAGTAKSYAPCFGQGSIVGVHLDSWRGTLEFFLNRKPLGIAFTGLRGLELYPMVCSTSAKTTMRITQSCSVSASLQTDALAILRPLHRSYLAVAFPSLRYLLDSIFANILRNKQDDGDDIEEEFEFPEEYMILDEFDYALIGYGRRKKKRKNLSVPYTKCMKLS